MRICLYCVSTNLPFVPIWQHKFFYKLVRPVQGKRKTSQIFLCFNNLLKFVRTYQIIDVTFGYATCYSPMGCFNWLHLLIVLDK